ncbi:GLPGLI family protein [Spirosoma aerophilum]
MKRERSLLLVTFSILCSTRIFGQAPSGILAYQQITAFVDTAKRYAIPFELRFNQHQSVSIPTGLIKKLNPLDSSKIFGKLDNFKRIWVYKDLLTKRIVSQQRADMENVVVDDTITPIDWKIINQFRTIGGMKCQKAEATTRGRFYTAWFTTEIPVSAGPWKLHGLPGLILEAYDNKGAVTFQFESLRMPAPSGTSIEIPIIKPGMNILTEEAFLKRRQDNNSRFDKMASSQPGMEGTQVKTEVIGIERFPNP